MAEVKLPEEWEFTTFAELVAESFTGLVRSANLQGEDRQYQYLKMNNLSTKGEFDLSNLVKVDADEQELVKYKIYPGDFIFNTRNSAELVGKCGVFSEVTALPVLFNNNLLKVTFHFINPKIVAYWLNSPTGKGQLRNITSATTSVAAIYQKQLFGLGLPVPPLAEQKVIADKLDTLLAQVETTKARLDRIPQILKTFRQSVLAAAVSGKLTEEWRVDNECSTPHNYRQICDQERKEYFDKKTKKLVDIEKVPDIKLPDNWVWQSLDASSLRITDGTHFSPKSTSIGDFMYITSKNVRAGYIDLSKISYIDEVTHREIYQRCDVKKGDVLYVKDGANTGLACVNSIEDEISLLSSVGVFKVCSFVNPSYLEHYLNSPMGRELMLGMMGGTAIPRLTLTKLAKAPFSLPPFEEQIEIVHRVEQLFAHADKIEQQAQAAQQRVDKLTQSILAKAFRGELTTQWRNDNPELITGDNSAEALLAKIKAEREAKSPKKKAKTKKAKA
jgi:type I restriction enzyme S subunit